MYLLEDVRTGSSDITEYLNCWLDHYARSHGKSGHSALDEDEKRSAVRELCPHMYENLSILDAKSGALIASNSITTAIFSIIALNEADPESIFRLGGFIQSTALILLVPSLIALIFNVSVLFVYWSTTKEISELTSVSDRARSLIRIRNARTRRYRVAFLVHFAVLSAALTILLLALLKSIPA